MIHKITTTKPGQLSFVDERCMLVKISCTQQNLEGILCKRTCIAQMVLSFVFFCSYWIQDAKDGICTVVYRESHLSHLVSSNYGT